MLGESKGDMTQRPDCGHNKGWLLSSSVVPQLPHDPIHSGFMGQEDKAAKLELPHKEGINPPDKEGGKMGVEEGGLTGHDLHQNLKR